MYLEKLIIKKFRSIDELEVHFNKGLNIIIGENNSGKTAIIDALRIGLGHGKQWKDIGIRNEEDFFIDVNDIDCTYHPIEFDFYFKIEAPEDAVIFNSMLYQDPADASLQNIQMHFRYILEDTPTGAKRMRWNSWGGAIEGQAIDPNEAQQIYYTYLAPLRNAEQELKPYAKDNKISSLFRDLTKYKTTDANGNEVVKTLDEAAKLSLAQKLEAVVQDDDWKGLIETGTAYINEHLKEADVRNKNSNIHLRLLEYKYENVIKGIVTRKPVFPTNLITPASAHKQRYFDVSQNGLGENNLVYASSVLGDLKNRRAERKEHFYSLLIEEPEAHLHPQRQNTFFNYLNNLRELNLQIFITSHSPTLTAKSDLDNIIIIQRQPNVKRPFTIKNSDLTTENKAYLRKFLDVTKSQLFFSNGVILVEGISEALLVPVFADMMGNQYNIDQNGIEIVNINGVAFEAFARLYNSVQNDKRLPSRCSILTDNDKGILSPKDFVNEAQGIDRITAKSIFSKLQNDDVVDTSNRILVDAGYNFNDAALNQHANFISQTVNSKRDQISTRAGIAAGLQSGNLRAKFAEYTFEYELMIASEINYRLMMAIYKKMHPHTRFLDGSQSIKMRALEFVAKLDINKDKSGFSERLARILDQRIGRTNFVVPNYIQEAVRWVIEAI
ncbi:ATP-dependent nuclease [Taibaiella koreensis]|uniref:ATP-dependent nuclease n=1 Tax=Taibaiella koreensis TaxID=1268548 RepID=UPI000E5A0DF4|nr:AAA family ATPase [Taibaiella koreensis]